MASMKRVKTLKHKGRRHLPLPTGPYTVGCLDIMTSYLKFGVFFRMYYPSASEGILDRYLQWPLWIPHKEYVNGYATRIGVSPKLYRFFNHLLVGNLHIPAVWQAPLLLTERKYPVIIFSHGLSGWRTVYSSICLELASYGFVVAAVEHRDHSASASFYKKQVRMSAVGCNPGSSLCDLDDLLNSPKELKQNTTSDKCYLNPVAEEIGPFCHAQEWVPYRTAAKEQESSQRRWQVKHRSKECAAVLDVLEDLSRGRYVANILDQNFDSGIFKNQLDLVNSFIVGHSFGGSTAILSLATEHRFRAGILLDPWMFPFYEDQSMFSIFTQPILCVAVKSFQTKESLRLIKDLQSLHANGEFFTMKKANHRDLSDVPFVAKYSPSLSSRAGFKIDKFSALDLTTNLILQYLGQHLGRSLRSDSYKFERLKKKYLTKEDFV